MTAIGYKGPLLAAPPNDQLFGERKICAKFQIDISKTEGLVRVYTDGQTNMAKSTQLVMLIIYVYILWGLRRFLLCVTNLKTTLIVPSTYKAYGKYERIVHKYQFHR